MRYEFPALMFKTPDSWATTDRRTNVPDGGTMYEHTVLVQGESVQLYSTEDKTGGLNGSRSKLNAADNAGVPVTVVLDLSPRRGRIKPKLVEIREAAGK
jgi:hypothetical protein